MLRNHLSFQTKKVFGGIENLKSKEESPYKPDYDGNATIIGASANVVAIGLAYKAGYKVGFWQFAKYGIPVTLISILMVYHIFF